MAVAKSTQGLKNHKYGIVHHNRANAVHRIECAHGDTIWNLIDRMIDEGKNKTQISKELPYSRNRLNYLIETYAPLWLKDKWPQAHETVTATKIEEEDYYLLYTLYKEGISKTELSEKWECSRKAISSAIKRYANRLKEKKQA